MESTDRQILTLLAKDGRMSYTDIGRETGLSTSAAQQRVRRLEQRGLITGYRAEISAEALGLVLTAFIALKGSDPATDDQIPERLAHLNNIVSCYSVAGDASYILIVQVETPAELEALLAQIRIAAGVSTLTTLVLSVPYRDRVVL
ncbi:MAG: Lrp/AsnC family transcriptional regulator [Micropruina glycogenica]|jgi:Lrp/AsnC family leucine-responsive transcriptional regulator|uniref:Transcriptional regulator, AsnC family n=1 Tax=Micropruina glycogenica TaxID=75385 RepID=A0A2N9JES2_9ACTN|nr:Lrp/AsnC family transcriptional regulator [Micropruina glycogenica]MCB0890726.1 Lrp/AsnC family transcriptional regulator [Propionibacteriaceae bacterium]SPD86060.1 Transcriptional regulator, AsnC family [Micropruina glycogenica]